MNIKTQKFKICCQKHLHTALPVKKKTDLCTICVDTAILQNLYGVLYKHYSTVLGNGTLTY